MEQLNDRELSIVGEAYASFSEVYRVNERRALNAFYEPVGERSADRRAEVAPGVWFSPAQTKEALLFGYEGFADAFAESQTRMERLMAERYEWRVDERPDTDVYGANVVVERVAAGHPETFTRPRQHMRKKRSVRIVYDTMCAASTPLDKRVEAACAVMAAARALEHVGYEVELDFALAKFSGNSMADDATLLLLVALKSYGEPFVASRMEFPLAAKSVLFHLGCFWAHRFAGTPMDYGPGEGYPLSYDPRRMKAMEAFAKKRGGVYLSEDIVEVQLAADPVRVLERVLGVAGDAEALALHVRRTTAMNVAANPRQGKLFSGVRADGGAGRGVHGEGEGERRAPEGAGADEGADASKGAHTAVSRGDVERPGEGESGDDARGGTAPDDGDERADAGACGGQGACGVPASDPRSPNSSSTESSQAFSDEGDGMGGAGVSFTHHDGDMQGDGHGGEESGDHDDGDGEHEDRGGQNAGHDSESQRGGDGGVDEDAHANEDARAAEDAPQHEGAGAAADDENGAEGMGEQGTTAEESRDGRGKKAASTETDGRDEEAGTMAHEQPEPEQSREEQSLERDDDPFVVMLRKRFVRFEEGAYREQTEAERIRAEAHREGRTPPAPPITAENSEGGFKLGAPRNTPFSISYVPKKK